ncbi:microfibrillar-associated protein 1-like [Octopus sinensis]|uniref:Microfibrillar-associated protein 1-like n=1 Tax=Octopus sinensis TaxID=2607531 RepID=A0A7E6EG00_9MOLL|nr:microfibrillar-associated protein 1-like [Octopus sinensis]
MLRQQILDKKHEPEPESEEEDEFVSEYEEYEEIVEEEVKPLPKPVFVSKKDRITLKELEEKEELEKRLEIEAIKIREEQRQHSLRVN